MIAYTSVACHLWHGDDASLLDLRHDTCGTKVALIYLDVGLPSIKRRVPVKSPTKFRRQVSRRSKLRRQVVLPTNTIRRQASRRQV
jgi:hypothetical protein